ncbi:probable G-protein coupled receptor 63 [Megalops cyprinoides]|uniref:probable G-protein coupled receptor 63 n=1 Tax=Megalops cyprinoides TaxID=118141 RepID=UPI00186445D0|nr:probable G-protein coupled receptor 63 [Megalops cyprinoides]XP_036398610.1 probable G-protein coupled receptor 63 [Megalops cyprinoides]XP_036398611.1 probable G-protein coupled receptor 63 [Megalops cyprinoides]
MESTMLGEVTPGQENGFPACCAPTPPGKMVYSTNSGPEEAGETGRAFFTHEVGVFLNISGLQLRAPHEIVNISTRNSSFLQPGLSVDKGALTFGLSVPLRVFFVIVMVSILLVAFLGNAVVCLLVYQRPTMRSAINILLASLALTDMLLAILNMPFTLVTVATGRWTFGEALCRVSAVSFWLFVTGGAAVLLVISVDRFLIIVRKQDKLSPRRAKALIAASWGVSLLFAFPLAVGDPRSRGPLGAAECVFGYAANAGHRAYVMLVSSVVFFVPFVVMLCSFLGILNAVRHNAVRIHGNGLPDSGGLGQAGKLGLSGVQKPIPVNVDMSFKTRAFVTILILFAVFTACWAPFATCSLISGFNRGLYCGESLFEISTWFLCLCYLKSALNPLIYYWRIKKFREACLELVPRHLKLLPQIPGHSRRRVRPSAVYACGEHRAVV